MACRRTRSPSFQCLHGLLSFSAAVPFIIHLLLLLLSRSAAAAAGATADSGVNRQFPLFREASAFRNGESCGVPNAKSHVHVAMTLDANYIRGTMAAVFSILQHSTCPENVVFHFLWLRVDPEISSAIRSTFPFLSFRLYRFDSDRVQGKISKSIRESLDQPLNYARIYLADILPRHVSRVIYLDSDLVVVDDINKLWEVDLEGKVVGAPEYCHANFTRYFSDAFWSNPAFASAFEGRRACYFNTGVMVDVEKWRQGMYTEEVEKWMAVQKRTRIYHLGSLPPFLLVLAGNIKAIDHGWNQHGLGGDNLQGKCRKLHSGSISLLHWSGKGKPWLRLDSRKPCSVDQLWAPSDLAISSSHRQSSFFFDGRMDG